MQFNRRFRLETANFKPPPEGGQLELL
jgi:hypothetical protein